MRSFRRRRPGLLREIAEQRQILLAHVGDRQENSREGRQQIAFLGGHLQLRDTSGFVVLSRVGATRRVPFWLRVETPKLRGEPHRTLTKTGTFREMVPPGPGLLRVMVRGADGVNRYLPARLAPADQAIELLGPVEFIHGTHARPATRMPAAKPRQRNVWRPPG